MTLFVSGIKINTIKQSGKNSLVFESGFVVNGCILYVKGMFSTRSTVLAEWKY